MPRVAFNLFAQAPHEYINRPRSYERSFFPNGIEQLVAGKDASAVSRKIFQKPELADSGKNGPALHPHRHRSDIDIQFADLDHFLIGRFRLHSEHVAHPRDQFARTERLGDVSVAADIESLQPVWFLSPRREEDDRRLAQSLVLPDLPA